ncbi:MAG: hypothetical protein Tsb009_30750 [Planctomycetaceae bacterium]
MTKETGAVDIELRRDRDWIDNHHAAVGGTVWLDLPGMGARGLADVLTMTPAPEVETLPADCDPSEFRLVTGTFKHSSGEVYDLKLEAESEPIGVRVLQKRCTVLN